MAVTSVRRQRQWGVLVPKLIGRILLYTFLILLAVFFLFPFYDMFIGSFMQDSDLFSRHPNIWPPNGFDVTNYTKLFRELGFGRPLFNSFYIATVQTLGAVFFCSLAGFAFAKRRFPGRDRLFAIMLLTMMLPYQATLIPYYLLMVKIFKWSDTYWPFWLPAWAGAFGIFLMRQFISSSVPDELLEAATIDGCSVIGSFFRIVVPVVLPGISVLAILTFLPAFNDFLLPLLILSAPSKITAALALANFKGTTIIAPRYSLMFAGSACVTAPLLAFYFAFQKQLISGITSGALKGGA